MDKFKQLQKFARDTRKRTNDTIKAIEEQERLICEIEKLSGMDLEILREKLAAGYTLTPPEEKGSVATFGMPIEDYDVGKQTEAFEKAGWSIGYV